MRIERWLREHAPEVLGSLGPPAPEPSSIPEPLRSSMGTHAGQSAELYLFEGFSLLTWAEASAHRMAMRELGQQFDEDYRAVGSIYWGQGWYPFLDDRAGTLVCVDTEAGRVITFFHDAPERPEVAHSIGAFWRAVADAMEAGECVVDEGGVRLRQEEHPLARALWGE